MLFQRVIGVYTNGLYRHNGRSRSKPRMAGRGSARLARTQQSPPRPKCKNAILGALDHKPLLLLYNEMSKALLMRVARQRNKVQDLRFTDKYLPGKSTPCDCTSRLVAPIEDLSKEEKERLIVEVGEDIQVMRVIMVDLCRPCPWRC